MVGRARSGSRRHPRGTIARQGYLSSAPGPLAAQTRCRHKLQARPLCGEGERGAAQYPGAPDVTSLHGHTLMLASLPHVARSLAERQRAASSRRSSVSPRARCVKRRVLQEARASQFTGRCTHPACGRSAGACLGSRRCLVEPLSDSRAGLRGAAEFEGLHLLPPRRRRAKGGTEQSAASLCLR